MNSTTTRGFVAAALAVVVAVVMAGAARSAAAAATQPGQPKTGPGGSSSSSAGVRVSQGGTGANAWFAFEPTGPKPKSAPLAVITHGYYEYSGYATLKALIEHTVRKGNVVIYPRWQTGVAEPCPGPFNIEPCMASEANGIKGALAFLRSSSDHVQPDTSRTNYFGFSFGGIITANLASRYQQFGVPRPRAVFLDDPHDGGLTGAHEPALDDSLAGIPSDTLFVCHSGASGIFTVPYTGTGDPQDFGKPRVDAGCNSVFPKLTSIPAANKDIVLTSDDGHGTPALSSAHGVCAGPTSDYPVDAYDSGFCWKQWDALRSAALSHTDCANALGDTPQHRYIGTWSDGVPITGLKIQKAAPIRAQPVPARQARPPAPRPTRAGLCGDRVAPRIKLRLRGHQAAGRLVVKATSGEDGRVRLRASIRTRGKGAHTYRVKQVVKRAKAGKAVQLSLRLTSRQARSLRRALRTHPASALVTVSARDEAGNLRKTRARIRVRK